ncbi:hypothetical protein ACAW74_19390 [Fibrella sp. WM1]|uniref:hypothetical protein n=1 Tax=Fibrella musci TaxID=3242485 RepID=UPI003520978E
MKTAQRFLLITMVTAALAGCKKTTETEPGMCVPPSTLVAQASCQSGYSGVQLIASDYNDSDGSMQFIYYIYPQKDTLSSDISKASYANASNERIIIDEAVLNNAPKFAVRVTVNCNGRDVGSPLFAFVKRPTASPGCYVWALQKQP